MTSIVEMKARIAAALRQRAEATVAIAGELRAMPELGFKEHRTSAFVQDALRSMGYEVGTELATTGVRARLQLGTPGPTVCVLGELDALPMPEHPTAVEDTGAAHACGHFLQLTHLLSLAEVFASSSIASELSGELVFLAVPAEEYVDLAWRREQAASGAIGAFSGKQQLLLDGAFDDVDIAMMCHAGGTNQRNGFTNRAGSAGFIGKRVEFRGRAAHAGRSPDAGVNTLNALSVALAALNANRDAFPDATFSRVHGAVTETSTTVSIVPSHAGLDFMIRGRTLESIRTLEIAFERSMAAGALAVGAEVSIETLPGYLPRLVDERLLSLARDNARREWGSDGWVDVDWASSSTDVGDLSHHLPVLHPNHGGCVGAPHDVGFDIADAEMACVDPAILMGHTIVDLLADGGREARDIVAGYRPSMAAEDYRSWARVDRPPRVFDGSSGDSLAWTTADE